MDVTLSGGDCGGNVLTFEAEPAVGDEMTAQYEGQTLSYRYIGGGQAVFTGYVP